jgi:hypothetical protein
LAGDLTFFSLWGLVKIFLILNIYKQEWGGCYNSIGFEERDFKVQSYLIGTVVAINITSPLTSSQQSKYN